MSSATTEIAIIGGAGTGQIIQQAIRDLGHAGHAMTCAGYLNDMVAAGETIDGDAVLGRFDEWSKMDPDVRFITGILKSKQSRARSDRIRGLGIPHSRFISVIHPSATIADSAVIGLGTYIGPNCVVMPQARIGNHVSIRANAYISHDVEIGDFAFVGPNATLNGRSLLEEGAHLGGNAVVADGIVVGAHAVVGIGSAAARNVAADTVVLGVPARFAGKIGEAA